MRAAAVVEPILELLALVARVVAGPVVVQEMELRARLTQAAAVVVVTPQGPLQAVLEVRVL